MMQILKKNLFGLLSLTSVLFALSGCEEQAENAVVPSPEDKLVTVSLNFGFADNNSDEFSATARVESGTAAFNASLLPPVLTRSSTDAPDKLYNLEIRQYDSNGNYLTGTDFGSTAQVIGTYLNVSLQQNADCQLVVVARGSGGAVSALGSKSLTEIQNMNVSSSTINAINPGSMNAMPYVLHLPHVKVSTAGKLQSIDGAYDARLLLKRLATRLTVNWTYNVSGYKLKQLLLQSIPLNFTIVDKPDGTDGTYPSLVSQFTTLEVPVTDATAASGSYSCWVPANVRGESAAATSDLQRTKDNAPTGSAFLNFVAVNTTDSKKKLDYRVYIGSGASTDFNMYRNKEYAYTVNFNHEGIPTSDRRVTYIDPIPASVNNNNVVPTANCFMVAPGGSFCFDPFAFQQNGLKITNSVLKGWCVNGTGIKSVRLLWQTKENGDLGDPVMGIANTDNDHTNIVDIKNIDGKTLSVPATDVGQCLVYCRTTANTSGGSGVIAAYDGENGTGNILWSWHVWVTDYNPEVTGSATVLTPANKRKFKLGTSTTFMMDRNLGAYDGAVSIPGTILEMSRMNGFHYQKGRKDPFPSSYTMEELAEVYKFELSATSPPRHIMNRYEADGIHAIVPQSIGTKATSLRYAYQNPVSIAGNSLYSGENAQWCTEYSNVRWDVTKTVHDPCPAGWRIPQQSDLNMLGTYNTTVPSDAVKNGGILLKYDDTNNRTYLRFTGYPPIITQLNYVGKEGYISSMASKGVFTVSGRTNKIETSGMLDYDAHTTRCVQERTN